jgi:histone H3/H4
MRIGISTSAIASKSSDRAANAGRSTVEDVDVDHHDPNVL